MRIEDISSVTWVRSSKERLPQRSLGRMGMEHLASFGKLARQLRQLDYGLRGKLSRRGYCSRELRRREVRGPQFDANGHVSAVRDEDVAH
jgi:hypothetical protein